MSLQLLRDESDGTDRQAYITAATRTPDTPSPSQLLHWCVPPHAVSGTGSDSHSYRRIAEPGALAWP